MKTKIRHWLWLGCVLLLCLSASPARAFYNPSTGRWLSRDPIGERGGANTLQFVKNAPIGRIDPKGLKCCALMYSSPTWNHAAIECDDGTYISAFPADGLIVGESAIVWHTKSDDVKSYGPATKKACFDCVSDGKISAWLTAYKASGQKFCGPDNNCSDIARQAILSGLTEDQQKKPICPKCPWFAGPMEYRSDDLLNPMGLSSPTDFIQQVEAWIKNDCKRYSKCKLWMSPAMR